MSTLAIHGGKPVRTAPWPKWPVVGKSEEKAILAVLRSGKWWRFSYGQGVELQENEAKLQSTVARFQRAFARMHGCAYGVCAANGTATLEIALRAIGLQPGDEVIVPAYTFIATASAVLTVGGVPIFGDIEPDTYNLDPARIEEAITSRTRAIIPVHFGGQPCAMNEINEIARKHSLAVIEDAAHAHGASYQKRMCGSLGACGSFSFQNSKNMTAGEGGILTTNDVALAEKFESLVWGGRKKGEPWYRHYVLAGNHRLTEFQGAILIAQLARLKSQTRRRMQNAAHLDKLLSQIEGIRPLARRPETTAHSHHLYMLRYDARAFKGLPKEKFVQAMAAEGVSGISSGYGTPLYKNPMFIEKRFFNGPFPVVPGICDREINYADFAAACPVSERACATEAVWLSQSMFLAGKKDMEDIAAAVRKIQRESGKTG
ncbi:MAG: DegT/DnrJ/EryC1/StrS family aminotransferase [Verrucomicrobia bacterium]|nr:DegT/DnrJ/EryC1/StrS family aminotransferase [Verrucomicrobiota bacterium]